LLEHDGEVVADVDEIDRPIAKRRAAMSVQIHGNHLPLLGERWQHGPVHVDRAEPAVQKKERLAAAVDLVVVIDAVGEDVALLRGRGLCRGCGAGVGLRTLRTGGRRRRNHGDAR
jgi:hypothetical protein